MSVARQGLVTAATAAMTIGVQLVALVSLEPTNFGLFSLVYLTGAFGMSVMLSVVSEAWARGQTVATKQVETEYSSAALYVALAFATVAAGIAVTVPELRHVAILSFIAVFCTTYRSARRYWHLKLGSWRAVLVPDSIGAVVALIAGTACLLFGNGTLLLVTLVWACTSVASLVGDGIPKFRGPGSLVAWWRSRNTEITTLLRDSLTMDLSSIGTPYLLAPLLGIANFGVYRGVSNVSAPVRLLLNPLRPTLSNWPVTRCLSPRVLITVTVGSVSLGLLCWGGLWAVGHFSWALGTLSSLSNFAFAVSVFVVASMVGHFYYLVCRQHATRNELTVGRLTQTGLSIVAPVGGALLLGLPGAIWGFTLATSVSAVAWTLLVYRARRRTS